METTQQQAQKCHLFVAGGSLSTTPPPTQAQWVAPHFSPVTLAPLFRAGREDRLSHYSSTTNSVKGQSKQHIPECTRGR